MKTYYVVYKKYKLPELAHFEVLADNKNHAKILFLQAGIKHDYVIKIIT